ncbi:MAG: hypothetical protein STHCBS139747_006104 [Sporothrix thermara]
MKSREQEDAPSLSANEGVIVEQPAPAPTSGDVLVGPARPPPADSNTLPSLDEDEDGAGYDDAPPSPPLSPYSAERAAARQLTMPRVPDFDIPGSPPAGESATPAEALAALNKKFATFLELKQKKDTHFHARLAQSDAMKNPALMDKLMSFVGLPPSATADDNGDDDGGSLKGKRATAKPVDTASVSAQYATTLPLGLWDPAAFPPEAYRRSLRRLQEEAAKQRARAPGERVDFVSATAEASASTSGITSVQDRSQSGTPAVGASTGKRKSRFD